MKKYNMKLIENLMDESITKLSKLVDDSKHKNNCGKCGQELDMRDLSQVFAHEPCNGFVDYETMEKIPYSIAIRIVEPILNTKNKEIKMEKYTPKFKINDKVYLEDKVYFVRGMIAKASSHPNPEIEYFLSKEFNRPSTTNKNNKENINENSILSLKDYKSKKIKEAKDFLISEGVIPQE